MNVRMANGEQTPEVHAGERLLTTVSSPCGFRMNMSEKSHFSKSALAVAEDIGRVSESPVTQTSCV